MMMITPYCQIQRLIAEKVERLLTRKESTLSMVLCLFTYNTGVEVVCEWGSDFFKLEAASKPRLISHVKWLEFFIDPTELKNKDYLNLLCDAITHALIS